MIRGLWGVIGSGLRSGGPAGQRRPMSLLRTGASFEAFPREHSPLMDSETRKIWYPKEKDTCIAHGDKFAEWQSLQYSTTIDKVSS